MLPKDRKYTKEHEWLLIDGNKAKIGITDFAQSELGDIVFVELPKIGDNFECGDSFAVVESVKAVSNIYTPVSGTIIALNESLDASPELINEAPYDNYIAEMEIKAIDDAMLMDADKYEAFIKEG